MPRPQTSDVTLELRSQALTAVSDKRWSGVKNACMGTRLILRVLNGYLAARRNVAERERGEKDGADCTATAAA